MMLAGALLGSLLIGGQAVADPSQSPPSIYVSEERGQQLLGKSMESLSSTEFRELAEYLIARQKKQGKPGLLNAGPETVATMNQVGTQIASTGVTIDWPNTGVNIEGQLFRPDNSQSYSDPRYCSGDHSCTYPTHYTDCTCQHGWWQLYVVGWQAGQASVADRADLLT